MPNLAVFEWDYLFSWGTTAEIITGGLKTHYGPSCYGYGRKIELGLTCEIHCDFRMEISFGLKFNTGIFGVDITFESQLESWAELKPCSYYIV